MAFDLKKHIELLQMAEAQGRLKPEHMQELESYRERGMVGVGKRMSVQDNKFLNETRETSQAGLSAQGEYRNAAAAIDRFGSSPWKAKLYDASLPEEGGGFGDTLGAFLVGTPARLFGAVTDDGIDDFQTLKGLQSQRVLTEQLAQKGPQTESDAARLKLTEVSPYKTLEANKRILDAGMRKATLAAIKSDFFTQWANNYGLNGTDPKGRTVDAAWSALSTDAQTRPLKSSGGGGRVDALVAKYAN